MQSLFQKQAKKRDDGHAHLVILSQIHCLLLCLIVSMTSVCANEKAVSYTFSGGRFGDNLLAYLHAKWISYYNQLPLLYQPFPYSDQLLLDDLETFRPRSPFEHTEYLGTGTVIHSCDPRSILYIIPYFPEALHERQERSYPFVPVQWDDSGFKAVLQAIVRPKASIPTLSLPLDRIAVGVHVRRGGGYDSSYGIAAEPLRFPPDTFFIEQIRHLYAHFHGHPLYVHIFTDDPDPMRIVHTFQHALESLDITFGYRTYGNRHDQHVLEDFFNMTQCHCLIRPASNFSCTAAKIADYLVEIFPTHFISKEGMVIIDQWETRVK